MKRFLLLAFISTCVQAQTPPPTLATAKPTRGPITRFITLPGTVRAQQQATLYAKVPGYLKSIAVDKGTAVKAGDILAELDTPELVADRAKAVAEEKEATVELGRLRQAQEKSPASVTEQQISIAQGHAEAAQATLERATTLLAYRQMVAPFSGIITGRYVDVGAFVPAATAGSAAQNAMVVTLADFSTVRLQVMVPENESALITKEQPVKFTVEAVKTKTFEGKVSRLSYALDEVTRSMLVEADLPNPELLLRPGLYATVKIGVEQHPSALLVPVEAIAMEKTAAFVFTQANGKAKKLPVKLGFNDGTKVEISEGLPEDAAVLLIGKTVLTDGQVVTVK
jgi:membrane fusion protein (multidrug efflux system)